MMINNSQLKFMQHINIKKENDGGMPWSTIIPLVTIYWLVAKNIFATFNLPKFICWRKQKYWKFFFGSFHVFRPICLKP